MINRPGPHKCSHISTPRAHYTQGFLSAADTLALPVMRAGLLIAGAMTVLAPPFALLASLTPRAPFGPEGGIMDGEFAIGTEISAACLPASFPFV